MDLMIECMPMPLYEMIEDDMKNLANLNTNQINASCNTLASNHLSINSNSASPSCLSDEEQLALTSCSLFDDFFFLNQLTSTSTNSTTNITNQNHNNQNNFEQINTVKIENDFRPICTLNESFSSSLSSSSSSASTSSSSSAVCSPLSSPLSLSLSSSSLCAALANTSFANNSNSHNMPSPSQIQQQQQQHQQNSWNISQIVDNNQYATSNSSYQPSNQTQLSSSSDEEASVSPVNTTVIQDSYMNNNFSLFQVINPLDINRNYTSNNINILHSANNNNNSNNEPKSANDKTNNKQSNLLAYSHQQIKRSKYSHSSASNASSLQIKQENLFNSDGESTGSNESNDSNSSFSSSNNNNNGNNNNCSTEYSKQLIKIEPYQLKNLTNSNDLDNSTNHLQQQQPQIISMNSSTPINVIKINNPKENKNTPTSLNNLINSSNCLKLPITTTKINTTTTSEVNSNHKTIIQYKQLLTSNPIKLQQQQPQPTQQQQQQTSIANTNTTKTNLQLTNNSLITSSRNDVIKVYPKPPYSYSCLIAMALRNSDTGNLPVSDIYDFIIENFPYYKTARDGWKNSIRHNLSLNKCFEKIENPTNGSKKGCLWALNPDKCKKLEEECKRCRQRDPINIRLSMSRPDDLNKIERGEQRIKKFSFQTQRKQIDANSNGGSNNNNTNNSSSSCNVSSSSSTVSSAAVSPTTVGLTQSSDQLLANDSFLIDWSNAKQNFILKEEDDSDQYFDDSDIKIDSMLLSTISSPATIRNIV